MIEAVGWVGLLLVIGIVAMLGPGVGGKHNAGPPPPPPPDRS